MLISISFSFEMSKCSLTKILQNISNARLKLAKNQANAKQQPEAELLLFENYSHTSSTLSFKNKQNNKCVFIQTITHNEDEHEN